MNAPVRTRCAVLRCRDCGPWLHCAEHLAPSRTPIGRAAARQGHLLPQHRRKRPDHYPGSSARAQNGASAHRQRRRAPGRHVHRLSTWTCICAQPNKASPSRAIVTVRNDGKAPLKQIPLQISSSLNWERMRVLGRDVVFPVATLNSDADHTGQLHEAAVPLPTPLAPGADVQLDVTYSGTIAQSAQRLLAIGTPQRRRAPLRLGRNRRGLHRPARLRQRRLVSGLQRARHSGRRRAPLRRDGRAQAAPGGRAFRLRLTVEFPHGHAPNRGSHQRPSRAARRHRAALASAPRSMAWLRPCSTTQPSALKRPASLSPRAPPIPAANTTLCTLPHRRSRRRILDRRGRHRHALPAGLARPAAPLPAHRARSARS